MTMKESNANTHAHTFFCFSFSFSFHLCYYYIQQIIFCVCSSNHIWYCFYFLLIHIIHILLLCDVLCTYVCPHSGGLVQCNEQNRTDQNRHTQKKHLSILNKKRGWTNFFFKNSKKKNSRISPK